MRSYFSIIIVFPIGLCVVQGRLQERRLILVSIRGSVARAMGYRLGSRITDAYAFIFDIHIRGVLPTKIIVARVATTLLLVNSYVYYVYYVCGRLY